jgi:hydroxypyruvate isomerase
MNLKFSANLGFLWLHLPMLERIAAAQRAGFDAVECHMPYDCPASDIAAALKLSGLPMVGLNTAIGAAGSDDIGLAAVPGQEQLARQYIDQAIDYAIAIGAANIHVVAGLTGGTAEAEKVYQDNLRYACKKAALEDKTIIIEPLNPR